MNSLLRWVGRRCSGSAPRAGYGCGKICSTQASLRDVCSHRGLFAMAIIRYKWHFGA